MATTVAATIDTTMRYLLMGQSEQRNRLRATISPSDTSITCEFPLNGIQAGTQLSIGLESLFVWDVDEANKTATVERAMQGTAAAAATAGTNILVNPRFSRWAIFQEVNNSLVSLSSPANGLFRVKAVELTASTSKLGYDLGVSDMQTIIDVRMRQPGGVNDWVRLKNWELIENADTSDFPSGNGLVVTDTRVAPGYAIQVRYRAEFGTVTTEADTLEEVGLPATATDILPLMIAGQLMLLRESKRTFTEAQPESRRAAEVNVGSSAQAAARLVAAAEDRTREEAARLRAKYPQYRR